MVNLVTVESLNAVVDTDAGVIIALTPAGINDPTYLAGNASVVTLTASRNLASSDDGNTLVYAGSSDITLTTPSGLSATFYCTVIQAGQGKVNVVAGSGVTQANIGLTQGANTFLTVQAIATNSFAIQNPTTIGLQPLGVSTIPFIQLASSSWTMAVNGAMTLSAAQPVAWPSAYIYMPANSITSSNPSGWYYATFNSTTSVTLYNNTYNVATGGKPAIPASPVTFSAAAGSNVTQDNAPIQGPTYTIPGGSLGPNGFAQVSTTIQTSNSAQSKVALIGYGGTTFQFASQTTTPVLGEIAIVAQNLSSTGRQMLRTQTPTSSSATPTIATQDTAANISVSILFNAGSTANDYVICHYARFSYQYGA